MIGPLNRLSFGINTGLVELSNLCQKEGSKVIDISWRLHNTWPTGPDSGMKIPRAFRPLPLSSYLIIHVIMYKVWCDPTRNPFTSLCPITSSRRIDRSRFPSPPYSLLVLETWIGIKFFFLSERFFCSILSHRIRLPHLINLFLRTFSFHTRLVFRKSRSRLVLHFPSIYCSLLPFYHNNCTVIKLETGGLGRKAIDTQRMYENVWP